MRAFWDEIRRRNLHRVTAAYAVIAWVLVQSGAILFPTFSLPSWTLKLLIFLLIAGLPILLTGLWIANPLPAAQATSARQRGETALIGLLALVLVATLAEFVYLQLKPATSTGSNVASTQDASIAVLAFNNMSSDKENEYFSDGISEELLNDLSQVPGLRVAGRTSSFSFKGKNVTIGDIGKALNVRTVLEGSVRREGNRVRITAQLVNAADGYHIWSESYDREIADIFAVQEEISRAITKELTGRLLGAKPIPASSRPQINPEAYTAYLRGRFFMNKRNKEDMLRAIDFFKQATRLEPDYADAHASLGRTYSILYANGQQRDTLQAAREETETALRLDPDNIDGLLTLAAGRAAEDRLSEAEALFRKVLKLVPNSAEAHHFYSTFLLALGLEEAALAAERRAAVLDPLAPIHQENIGDVLLILNRKEEAARAFQAALTLDANFVFALYGICRIDAEAGKIDEANSTLGRLIVAEGEDGSYTNGCKIEIARAKGDQQELERLARKSAQLYAAQNLPPTFVGLTYAYAGDIDAAFEWFDRAYNERDIQFLWNRRSPSLPAKVTADPRWRELMQRPLFRAMEPVRAEIIARGAGG